MYAVELAAIVESFCISTSSSNKVNVAEDDAVLATAILVTTAVVALGDANPEKKADWIEDKVKAGFDDVYFIDDSPKNVEAVRKRLKNYPNVKQKIQQVKPKEEMESQSTKLTSMLPKADLTKTIKNPDTGRDIKLKSALQYDKDSKVFKAAEKMIKK